MRELKICEIEERSQAEALHRFNRTLNNLEYENIFEVLEPFQIGDTWRAGIVYWEKQRLLKAV